MEPFFSEAVRLFRFSSSSLFRGRRTGGKSGEILILSLCDFRFLAFCNHWLRCCRSLNRTITPALSLFESLWQAAKSNSDASAMLRWSLANFTHAGSTCYVLVFIGCSVQSSKREAPFTAMDVKVESLQSQLGGNPLLLLLLLLLLRVFTRVCRVAQPSVQWELHYGEFFKFFDCSCYFLAVFASSLWFSTNISYFSTVVVLSLWMAGQAASTCSWVSVSFWHALHARFL